MKKMQSLTPMNRRRLEFWFEEVLRLRDDVGSDVDNAVRSACKAHNHPTEDGDVVSDAFYAIGAARYHVKAQGWLAEDTTREPSRGAMLRRLHEAETEHRMTGSEQAAAKAAALRELLAEHDGRPTWHAEKHRQFLDEARALVGQLAQMDHSSSSEDDLVGRLSFLGRVPIQHIEARAAFEHAGAAVLEYADTDDWDQAMALANACVLDREAARSGQGHAVASFDDVTWPRVALGGSVNQNGRRRRTRGAG